METRRVNATKLRRVNLGGWSIYGDTDGDGGEYWENMGELT